MVLFLLARALSEEGGAVREWGVREQVLWERSQAR
jgi:hypothetical protein